MGNFLILTTDLPYFPGKNGNDFFNARYLAKAHRVGVVAPRYAKYPEASVANLAAAVDALYCWPDEPKRYPLFISEASSSGLKSWFLNLPALLKRRWLMRRLGITGQPDNSHEYLAILANCAPQLLSALHERQWQGIILIQSSLASWFEFLPRAGAKVVYFHDVRSDYLSRSTEILSRDEIDRVHFQEKRASQYADAVGFVSALDLDRAANVLPLPDARHVSPIPVDTDYFVPRPSGWAKDPRKIVLFTGHLRHPPNVDAVLSFLETTWPAVQNEVPDAVFQAVGLDPDPKIQNAIASVRNAELHPNVPDIRPYFWNADVYVVPMRYGGGVRQKIFEAWAMRLPVVSTTMGAEGTGGKSGQSCFLEDTPAKLGKRVVDILLRGASAGIVESAYKHVIAHNSIPAAASAFEHLAQLGVRQRRRHPYRMLFDLRWMEIGKAGGTEQMTHELVHAISGLDRSNHYRAYVPRATYYEWDLEPGFTCVPYFSDPQARRMEAKQAAITNRLAESLNLPPILTPEMRTLRAWKQMDFDIVHSLGGYIHPDLYAFPHILTVHDLQHLTYQDFFGQSEWQEREHLFKNSANRAAHIIAISEFTRQDIHRHYGIPLEKITTIWNIPGRHSWVQLSEDIRSSLLKKLGLHAPFILFPAHCWPHKNHTRLIDAFALILPHIDRNIRLVLTGRPFPSDHPALEAIARHGLEKRVLHLGYRSTLEMKALFQGCLLLTFPSLFEGFGMPVAEAIIAGKPVACSNTTSLPEIAGNAALTFDPENIHDIGGRLLEIINDPTRRSDLSRAALARRPLFSSKLVAVKTLDLYQRVHTALYQ